MGFFDSFADPSFTDVDVNRFRRRADPESIYGNQNHGLIQSRGMIDQVGNRGMFGRPDKSNPDRMSEFGPQGIQNITGFSQEAPNVVYDQRPEQFEKELKLRGRELDIRDKESQARIAQNEFENQIKKQNADTALGRNDIAMFKAMNPNMIIKASAGGNYHAIDPQTGQVIDTGIPVGNMTQQGAINLQNQGAMDRVNATNTGAMERATLSANTARDIAGMRNSGDINEIIARALLDAKNNATPSMTDQAARAMQLLNESPELRPFVQISPDGKGVIVSKPQPNMGSGQTGNPGEGDSILGRLGSLFKRQQEGPTEEQWRRINEAIYKPRVDVSKIIQNPGTINTPFMTQTPTVNAGGKIEGGGPTDTEFVVMQFPDGKKKKVPKAETQKWTSMGGKVVQ